MESFTQESVAQREIIESFSSDEESDYEYEIYEI